MTKPVSDFHVIQIDRDRVFLIDLDLGRRSVTNDADNVAVWVQQTYPGKRLIYRDSMGRWDEIALTSNNVVVFLPYDDYLPDNATSYAGGYDGILS